MGFWAGFGAAMEMKMADSEHHKLSTGETAKLCSVKPDTVLKWITKGLLRASRTAGGHYRIDCHDIEPFIRAKLHRNSHPPPETCTPRPLRCWEYMGEPDTVTDVCRKCVVYRVRATWCFEVLGLTNQKDAKRLCQTHCEDCVYYRRVRALPTRVLVVSTDVALTQRLASEKCSSLEVHFARNGYEACALVGTLRPAFVVVDTLVLEAGEHDLLDCLRQDRRVPGMKIVVAVPASDAQGTGPAGGAVFKKPISYNRLFELIQSYPVEGSLENAGSSGCDTGAASH